MACIVSENLCFFTAEMYLYFPYFSMKTCYGTDIKHLG